MSNPFNETALEQEGARAAQAGRPWQSNPFLRRENMPLSTGETIQQWSCKHDAWQRGFEGHAVRDQRPKEALSPQAIATIVEHRLGGLVPVRAELQRPHGTGVRVELPRRHARDEAGRNWNVDGFECGSLDTRTCEAGFRTVVDKVRDLYDLA